MAWNDLEILISNVILHDFCILVVVIWFDFLNASLNGMPKAILDYDVWEDFVI